MLKAVLFDFDGVVADSMGLKLECYLHALRGFRPDPARVEELQIRNAGHPRREVLRAMHRSLLGSEPAPESLDRLVADFEGQDESNRGSIRLVPGVLDLLKSLQGRLRTAIITGTPQDVIDRTVDQLRLAPFFDQVRGTPGDKASHMRAAMEDFGASPRECAYIGDAEGDQRSADVAGVPFVAFGGRARFAPGAVLETSDFARVRRWIEDGF